MSSCTTHTSLPSETVILLLSLLPMIVFATNQRQQKIQSQHFHLGLGDIEDTSSFKAKYDLPDVMHCSGACTTTAGCKSFFYTRLTRICQIHSEMIKQRKQRVECNGTRYFYKEDDDRRGRTKLSLGDELEMKYGNEHTIVSSKHSNTEISRSTPLPQARFGRPTAVSETDGGERLLFIQKRTPRLFSQYFLRNKTVSGYTSLQVKYVTDAVYVWTVQKLIVSWMLSMKVSSVPLDSSTVTDLKTGVLPRGLGVDMKRQIIFLSYGSQKYKLGKMTIDGKNFQSFFNVPGDRCSQSLAIDSLHRQIYYTATTYVGTVGYDGKGHQVLYNGRRVNALSVHPSGDYLYFADGWTMFNRSLSHPKQTKMIRLKQSFGKLFFCADRLYASPRNVREKLGFVQSNVFSALTELSSPAYKIQRYIAVISKCRQE